MGVDSQHNWLIDDIFTFTADFVCQEVDCLFNFCKISELLVGNFVELCPWLNVLGCMIESQLQGSPCDDTITSWEEIKTDDGFEHR